MKLQNRKSIIIALVALFTSVFQASAVFEGRNEKLQDYTSVRNNVNLESYNAERSATGGINLGDYQKDETNHIGGKSAPISDSPFFFLFLGGLSYGVYVFRKRKMAAVS